MDWTRSKVEQMPLQYFFCLRIVFFATELKSGK
jgi:hypothetical protein